MKKGKRIIIILAILTIIVGCSIFYLNNISFAKTDKENKEEGVILSDDALAFYLRQDDGSYKETVPNGNKWPKGYRLNYVLSGCVDSNGDKIAEDFNYVTKDKQFLFKTSKATFCYLYFDKDSEAPAIKSFNIDKEYTNSLTNSFYLNWDDDDVEFYCLNTTASTSGCTWKPIVSGQKSVTDNVTISDVEEVKTIYAYIKDEAGNVSEVRSDVLTYDKTPPTFTLNRGSVGYYSISVSITNEKDNLSGVDYNKIYYKIDNGSWINDPNNKSHTFSSLSDGTGYMIYAKICDKVGNCSNENDYSIRVYTDEKETCWGLGCVQPGAVCCLDVERSDWSECTSYIPVCNY